MHEEHLNVYNFKKKERKKRSVRTGAGKRIPNCRAGIEKFGEPKRIATTGYG